jgi:MraZ protein
MFPAHDLLLGEFPRTLDERYRLSIPAELLAPLTALGPNFILAKERPGCLSLWPAAIWQQRLQAGIELVQSKIRGGRLEGRLDEVQTLGRLLSTRHRELPLAARGRLLVPEGFREFLQVEAGGDVMIVGAAVCLEIWKPSAWQAFLEAQMPQFRHLFDQLSA